MPSIVFSAPINETFYPFSTGSVSAHIIETINGYISGKQPGGSSQSLYSTDGTRNPNLMTGALDLSAFNKNSNVGSPVLVSSRHVLSAAHVSAPTSVTFLKSDGSTVSRNVVASTSLFHPIDGAVSIDIRVSLLQSAIADVTPVYVPPADFHTKLPGGTYYDAHLTDFDAALDISYLPLLRIEGHADEATAPKLVIQQGLSLTSVNFVLTSEYHRFRTYGPTQSTCKFPQWIEWGEYVLPGDSSGALFWPINGAVCLVGQMYSLDSSNYGTEAKSWFFSPCRYASQINATMQAQALAYDGDATAYALTHQDWSGFVSV